MEAAIRVGTSVPTGVREHYGSHVPFGLRVVPDGTGVVVRLSGDFDLAGHMRFEAEVQDRQWDCSVLVIDLREVTFMDSCGLRSLVDVWQRSQREGFELAIVRGPAQVQRLFDLTAFGCVLPLVH